MKKFWKALGIAALAAAVIPYRVHKDDETGEKTVEALLWQATRGPGGDKNHDQVDISLGFKSPFQAVREEKALFTDDPEEAVLFADDEPEAAVVAAGLAEEQTEAAAEEAAAAAEEAEAAEEAGEEDFDPEA